MKTADYRGLIIFLLASFLFIPSLSRASNPTQSELLEAYLRVFPDVKSIGIIYSQAHLEETIQKLSESAKPKKIDVVKIRVPSIKELPKALEDMKGKVDTFWVLDESIFSIQEAWNYFIMFTFRNRIKTVVFTEKALSLGGLFYYTEDKEIMINKRILDVLGLKVVEGAGPVHYYSGKES